MKPVIVLAMHGSIPKDFPQEEKLEFLKLHSQIDNLPEEKRKTIQARHDELDEKMRNWPRSVQNDKFHFSSNQIAVSLEKASGSTVMVGYNEFCAPNLTQALEDAVEKAETQVLVITPMMTQGGIHAEFEIPDEIKQVQEKYPDKKISYVWPFDTDDIADFFVKQIEKR